MTVLEALRAGRARIERGWCQGEFACDAGGQPVAATAYGAIRYCAIGGVYGREWGNDAVDALQRALGRTVLEFWNDAPERTQADVLALYDRAIAVEEAKEEA